MECTPPAARARRRTLWLPAAAGVVLLGFVAPWAEAREGAGEPAGPARAAAAPEAGVDDHGPSDSGHDLAELSTAERRALARWERAHGRLTRARAEARDARSAWRRAQSRAAAARRDLAAADARVEAAQARADALAAEVKARLDELHAIGARLYMHSGGSDLVLPLVADGGDPTDRSRREVYAGSASDDLDTRLELLDRRQAQLAALRVTLAEVRADAARTAARRATGVLVARAARTRAEIADRQARAEATAARRVLRGIRARRSELETETVAATQRSNAITLLLATRQRDQVQARSFRARRPVPGVVTSGFGYRVHPILRTRRWHMGVDMRAATGDPVRAAAGGTVAFAGVRTGYGNTVIIDHGNRYATLYGHLSAIGVQAGDTVRGGAVIGAAGSTGMSTGPHLHFEVRVLGLPHNPLDYL